MILVEGSTSTSLFIIFTNRALQSHKVETWIISLRTTYFAPKTMVSDKISHL